MEENYREVTWERNITLDYNKLRTNQIFYELMYWIYAEQNKQHKLQTERAFYHLNPEE